MSKEYRSVQATNAALQEQIKAMKGVNETRARALELTLQTSQAQLQQMRQDTLMGKSPGAVNEMMRQQREQDVNVRKFRARDERTGGLLNVERDMSGNILSGVDPLTGERRTAGPGQSFGQTEHGLTTGKLGGGSTAAPGYAKTTVDRDPNGGLSFPGSIARPSFSGSTAETYLNSRPTVEGILDSHRGNPDFDPRARLAMAPTWIKNRDRPAINPATMLRGGNSAGEVAMKAVGAGRAEQDILTRQMLKMQQKMLDQHTQTNAHMGEVNVHTRRTADGLTFTTQ